MGKRTRLLETRSRGGGKKGRTPRAALQPPRSPLKPLFSSPPHHRGLVPEQVWARCGRRGPGAALPRARLAPGAAAEEGALPVSELFLGASPQARPWRPSHGSERRRSRSGPARQAQREGSALGARPQAWASRDMARDTLGISGRAWSCSAQGRAGAAGRVPRHHQQGKPSGVTEPEMMRILPEAFAHSQTNAE